METLHRDILGRDIQIFVKVTGHKTFLIEVFSEETIAELVNKSRERVRCFPNDYVVMHRKRALRNYQKSLSEVGMKHGDLVYINVNLRGGNPNAVAHKQNKQDMKLWILGTNIRTLTEEQRSQRNMNALEIFLQ